MASSRSRATRRSLGVASLAGLAVLSCNSPATPSQPSGPAPLLAQPAGVVRFLPEYPAAALVAFEPDRLATRNIVCEPAEPTGLAINTHPYLVTSDTTSLSLKVDTHPDGVPSTQQLLGGGVPMMCTATRQTDPNLVTGFPSPVNVSSVDVYIKAGEGGAGVVLDGEVRSPEVTMGMTSRGPSPMSVTATDDLDEACPRLAVAVHRIQHGRPPGPSERPTPITIGVCVPGPANASNGRPL